MWIAVQPNGANAGHFYRLDSLGNILNNHVILGSPVKIVARNSVAWGYTYANSLYTLYFMIDGVWQASYFFYTSTLSIKDICLDANGGLWMLHVNARGAFCIAKVWEDGTLHETQAVIDADGRPIDPFDNVWTLIITNENVFYVLVANDYTSVSGEGKFRASCVGPNGQIIVHEYTDFSDSPTGRDTLWRGSEICVDLQDNVWIAGYLDNRIVGGASSFPALYRVNPDGVVDKVSGSEGMRVNGITCASDGKVYFGLNTSSSFVVESYTPSTDTLAVFSSGYTGIVSYVANELDFATGQSWIGERKSKYKCTGTTVNKGTIVYKVHCMIDGILCWGNQLSSNKTAYKGRFKVIGSMPGTNTKRYILYGKITAIKTFVFEVKGTCGSILSKVYKCMGTGKEPTRSRYKVIAESFKDVVYKATSTRFWK